MTLTKYIQYGFVILAILLGAYAMGVHTLLAKAAATAFKTDCVTASATSTLTYMTPGTATTTVTCKMGSDGAKTAVLALQVNASSTVSVFNVYAEESMDGIDWYPIPQEQVASTSAPFTGSVRQYTTFLFASSTIGGGALGTVVNGVGVNGTQNRNHYEVDVPVRMKQVRAYTGITGANAGVWMQIVPKVEI